MNSEQLKSIQEFENQEPLNRDIRVERKAIDIKELTEMPGWQAIIKDLEAIRDGLMKALLDASTLKDAQVLQGRIKNIDLFTESPKKYIKQSEIYLKRRFQWQQKK